MGEANNLISGIEIIVLDRNSIERDLAFENGDRVT